jgi:hypothetical protein
LEATLSGPAEVRAGDPVTLEFTLVNRGTAGRYVLRWYTPLEGIYGKIFHVTRDGEPLEYGGPLVMRGDPLPDDYVWVDAQGSVSAEVDLATAYDLTQPGTYSIGCIAPEISHVAQSRAEMATTVEELGPIELVSNEVVVEITTRDEQSGLPRSMKGYELYSLPGPGESGWTFTLITGTNRNKSYQEIAAPGETVTDDGWVKISVEGVEALKAALERLPRDETVIWMDVRRLSGAPAGIVAFPEAMTVEEIVGYGEQRGLSLSVAPRTGDQ